MSTDGEAEDLVLETKRGRENQVQYQEVILLLFF